MKCSKCNHEYDDSLPACPLCGEPAPVSPPEPRDTAYTATSVVTEERVAPAPAEYSGTDSSGSSHSSERRNTEERPPVPPYPPRFSQDYQNTRPPYQPQLPPEIPQGSGAAPLVLGILSLLIPFVGLVLAIIAIVMGNNQRKSSPAGTVHNSLGHAGWILGIIGLCFQAFLIVYLIAVMGFVMSMVGAAFDQFGSYAVPSYSHYNF